MLISTSLNIKQLESMKELQKILLVPIGGRIEVWITPKLACVESITIHEEFNSAKLEFEIFHHYGMVAVVVEEHYVLFVGVAVGFVVWFL
jgi:hypothetical protein